MTEPLQSGFIITAIGMGLVFAAILLLWGLMALMVRIGANPEDKSIELAQAPADTQSKEKIRSGKNLAAVAALALALALKERSNITILAQLDYRGSPWLQIQRAQTGQEKSRLFSLRQNRRS